ncbi:hypothetical protein FDP08_01405 [Marinobacter panjinensis]|uniref:Uncharacterized protein n=1 Tax=Marinobacter panjinensis TaxID=2576384 RepID=A0A4U6R234_9GAMM|nr:hypothetical protein [Marinobacter panjinensis]MCR8915591.1 hypothetical protein [Marinobacter panjinensis]TKV66838.1 hypothetical protein FDP08_01405 [Marinobacter panjinensis]
MNVTYRFRFEDNRSVDFKVTDQPAEAKGSLPAWTKLEHCQCSNCPLKASDSPQCPAAVEILPVVNQFQAEDAYQKVDVIVTDDRRTYSKSTTLEEALRSLLGLKMATSGCPVLSELKSMAVHHLPFASNDEFIMRSVSHYLLQQYLAKRNHQEPDWDLKGLVERNQRLQLVNQALWQRIHSVCKGDSNLKALLNFFSMASSVSFSLESQLRKLEAKMRGDGAA